MLELEKIKKECKELQEKKSWIEKGVNDLLEKINDTLGKIELDEYFFSHYKELDNYVSDPDVQGVGLGIRTNYNEVEIVRTGYIDEEEGWKIVDWFEASEFDTADLRFIVEKIPVFLEKLHDKLQEENKENEETINKIKNMLDKLS